MENVQKTGIKNKQMLKALLKNAQMGALSLKDLLPKCKDGTFYELLRSHYESFSKLHDEIKEMMTAYKIVPGKVSCMSKMMLGASINMSTLFNSDPKKLADMLIKGDNMGIIDVNKSLNRYGAHVTDDVKALTHRLLDEEQRQIDVLKRWL